MNPMHLLTVSKSLMDIKDASGRYRMTQGNLLPKFNAVARVVPPAPIQKADAARPQTKLHSEDRSTARSERKSDGASISALLKQAREIISNGYQVVIAMCSRGCRSVNSVVGN